MATAKKTTTAKSANYNEKQEAFLLANYKAGMNTDDLKELAVGVNELADKGDTPKTAASLRSKLATMKDANGEKLYQPAKKVGVGAPSSERKIHLVHQIEELLGEERNSLISLEKANKPHLELLEHSIAALVKGDN